jgi:hypothetical protein
LAGRCVCSHERHDPLCRASQADCTDFQYVFDLAWQRLQVILSPVVIILDFKFDEKNLLQLCLTRVFCQGVTDALQDIVVANRKFSPAIGM